MRRDLSLLIVIFSLSACVDGNSHDIKVANGDSSTTLDKIKDDKTISVQELSEYAHAVKAESVDDLLRSMKQDALINGSVYVYKSGGQESHEVTETFPRVILNVNTNAWLAFTSKPGEWFTNKISYIAFDEVSNKFELALFKFDAKKMELDSAASENCKSCHMQDVNLIWPDAALNWDGILGSRRGYVPPGSHESTILNNLEQNIASKDPHYERYRIVGIPAFNDSSDDEEDSDTYSADFYNINENATSQIARRATRVIYSGLKEKKLDKIFAKRLFNCTQTDLDHNNDFLNEFYLKSGVKPSELVRPTPKNFSLDYFIPNYLHTDFALTILKNRLDLFEAVGVAKSDAQYWANGGKSENPAHTFVSMMLSYFERNPLSTGSFEASYLKKICDAL